MKYLQITPNTKLEDLAKMVGEQNVDYILNANGLKRTVNIGKQVAERDLSGSVDAQTKITTLNTLVANSDVYEKAALGDDKDWVALANYGTFPDYLKIPDDVQIPSSDNILGNEEPISNDIYNKCVASLKNTGAVNPSIFSEYNISTTTAYGALNTTPASKKVDPFECRRIQES